MQLLFLCQFEVGAHLELKAIIDICVPGKVVTVVPTPFVTISVIVIMIATTATAAKKLTPPTMSLIIP
jgi:hypothetical protein